MANRLVALSITQQSLWSNTTVEVIART